MNEYDNENIVPYMIVMMVRTTEYVLAKKIYKDV